MTTRACPVPREGVLVRDAAGTHVVLDPASGRYFTLDEVGGRIWALCDGREVSGIVDQLAAEYDAERDVLEADVLELLSELSREQLITIRR